MQQCKIQTTGRWKKSSSLASLVISLPYLIETLNIQRNEEYWHYLETKLLVWSKYKNKNTKCKAWFTENTTGKTTGRGKCWSFSASESSDLSLSSGNTIFNKQPNIGKWDKEMLPSVKMWESKRFRGSYPFSTSHIHISGAYLYW